MTVVFAVKITFPIYFCLIWNEISGPTCNDFEKLLVFCCTFVVTELQIILFAKKLNLSDYYSSFICFLNFNELKNEEKVSNS